MVEHLPSKHETLNSIPSPWGWEGRHQKTKMCTSDIFTEPLHHKFTFHVRIAHTLLKWKFGIHAPTLKKNQSAGFLFLFYENILNRDSSPHTVFTSGYTIKVS
jgi:hypothetical protein